MTVLEHSDSLGKTSLSGHTRVLLLVEDNDADAHLVRELLAQEAEERFQVEHVSRVAHAQQRLKRGDVDVVVLDLNLPDGAGVDTVRMVRRTAGDTPIVVLTNNDDERLASACIAAGAQDYLVKRGMHLASLRRAIGYAISRTRDAQIRELQHTLEQYRQLSSAGQVTTITAALAGTGAISIRHPELFEQLVNEYFALLRPFLARATLTIEVPRVVKAQIATMVGDATGGPRDLLDVHVAALDRAVALQQDPQSRTIVFEARLLALEMMGLLVDYYRVGHRRRAVEAVTP